MRKKALRAALASAQVHLTSLNWQLWEQESKYVLTLVEVARLEELNAEFLDELQGLRDELDHADDAVASLWGDEIERIKAERPGANKHVAVNFTNVDQS